ncbi:uncharacterized protein LOC141616710 [Silene latifolia]|uniref:uncharacterized protein LOC141616710 n=1 Tax=Silene latifolia TaxID=37657 RepID=UPI003D783ED0
MATFYSNAFLKNLPSPKPHPTTTTTNPRPTRPKIRLRKRGQRLPIVRLGGGGDRKKSRRRGFFLTKLFRRARLKWLRLSMFKKLKQYYKSLIKDIMEASASVEAYQQRMVMESSLAVPGLGVSFSNFHGGSLRSPRSVFI